ncbi:MAG: MarR family transcriptional regulator [Pseudomonadota bacterium]
MRKRCCATDSNFVTRENHCCACTVVICGTCSTSESFKDDFTCTATELADKTGVTKATMTGFIDGLERDHLIERIADKIDRRKMLIKLTPAGQKKLDEVMPDYHAHVHDLMSHLSAVERAAMLHGVKTLSSNIKSV